MANIRPNQLPAASSVNPAAAIIVDAGGPVQKATPIQVVDSAIPLATEEEAEAGTDNVKRVTPLRVKQAIDALGVSPVALAGGALPVGVQMPFSGAVLETTESILAQEVRITSFGAVFDVGDHADIADAADDTAAWVAALAHLQSIGGGTLLLPPGASKVTAQIDWPVTVPVAVRGTGRRKVYPGVFSAGVDCPSTLVPVHTGRCAIRFIASANGQGGFCAQDFNIATLESGDRPTAGFGWETQGGFLYGFTFWRVGVHGFTSAFDVYKTGGAEAAVGNVVIENCSINRNSWIIRTLDTTQFNGMRFHYNEAGQNGYLPGTGGIAISGHNVSIIENIIESTRDAISCQGTYNAVEIKGNYFENNVGTACIQVGNAVNCDIGPNNYGMGLTFAGPGDNPATGAFLGHKVYLFRCHLGQCIDPYWSAGVNKFNAPLIGVAARNTLNTNLPGYNLLRADGFENGVHASEPFSTARTQQATTISARDINPQTGNPFPVQEYSTTGTGQFTGSVTISGSSGQWVGFSWPLRRISTAALDPFITLVPNNDFDRRVDLPFNNYRHCWINGEWSIISGAFKLDAGMTSLNYILYPYGVSPASGFISRFVRPFVYVMDDVNYAKPFLWNDFVDRVSAAPTAGTWVAGDNLRRTAGGFFVCTAGGTPGTWQSILPS